jgi:peptidyl-prolyl cis-trans isomerase A (cyclophilin A)
MMFKKFIFLLLLLPLTTMAAEKPNCALKVMLPDNYFPTVKLETSMGDVVVELNTMKSPAAANNFLRYVMEGEMDGTVFHRVMEDFVVQGGGYNEIFEEKKLYGPICNESGNGLKNVKGTIAMARFEDPHSARRQFFFNLDDNDSLDPSSTRWGYAVFGTVRSGMEVLQEISEVKTGYNEYLDAEDVPKKNVMLIKATVLAAE